MATHHLLPRAISRLSEEEREHITLRFSPAIQAFLREAMEKKVLLTVFYGPEKHFFVSHFFKISEHQSIIDAPPSVIRPRLKPDDLLQVMGTLEQVPFHFTVHAYTTIPWEGYPALSFSTPKALIRLQRRSTFRLVIPMSHHLRASYTVENDKHEGRVADISTGGIRLTDLSPQWLKDLSRGQMVQVSIQLDGVRFKLPMSVTNAQLLRFANGRTIGQLCLRFHDLPQQTENHIARFLMRHEVLFTR